MNLINYNQAIEALEKERQLLLNREQYGAENVLVHHAINVIVELPIIRQPEIVRCKDCKCWENGLCKSDDVSRKIDDCGCYPDFRTSSEWFCADGKRR